MSEVVYLEFEEVVEIHEQLLDRFGGLAGFKERGAVESAVMWPRTKAHYEGADLLTQAAAMYFGLIRSHGFADGNKRIGVTATDVFLQLNGWEFVCSNETIRDFTLQCSDGTWTEACVVEFVKANTAPRSS